MQRGRGIRSSVCSSILGVVLAVLAVSAAGVAAFAVWDAASALGENAVELAGDEALPPSLGEIEGGVNLLLVGTDSCEGQDVALFPRCATPTTRRASATTSRCSCTSATSPRRITVVSFPRDMLVPIPACPDGRRRLLLGDELAADQRLVRLRRPAVHGHDRSRSSPASRSSSPAAIRWTGVINMSDAIGGVDVCVAGDISDPQHRTQPHRGPSHAAGVEALQFLRIRHGIGDGSDLGRISNQQQFMSSMVRKLQSEPCSPNPGAAVQPRDHRRV